MNLIIYCYEVWYFEEDYINDVHEQSDAEEPCSICLEIFH